MKTPFKAHFGEASIPLKPVNEPPFVPLYPMPFVPKADWVNLAGDGVRLIYREHDGFDVYVGVLEIHIDHPSSTTFTIPVESLLCDLHLVYQLAGSSVLPGMTLPYWHHIQVYAPPGHVTLHIEADPDTCRYATCCLVPKGKWVSRTIGEPKNPLNELIRCLKASHQDVRFLAPQPLSHHVNVWLLLLLTAGRYPRMLMDSALNHATANLIEVHLTECQQTHRIDNEAPLINAVRLLAEEQARRCDGDRLISVDTLAQDMKTKATVLRELHKKSHGVSLDEFVSELLMQRAKLLLEAGMTVKSTALTLGYSTPNNFSRAFKNKFGVSPEQYRRQQQKKNVP